MECLWCSNIETYAIAIFNKNKEMECFDVNKNIVSESCKFHCLTIYDLQYTRTYLTSFLSLKSDKVNNITKLLC